MDATQAIVYLFNSLTAGVHNDLWNDVQGRMSEGDISENTDYPHIIIVNVTEIPDDAFAKKGSDRLRQISLYSSSSSPSEIKLMRDHATALFDDCSLSITGETLIWMRRVNIVGPLRESVEALQDATEKIWVCHIDYELTTQAS